MNSIKKFLGILWMLLAPIIVIFLFFQAFDKTGNAPEGIMKINTALQWGIILFIFIPICSGLAIFGFYAIKGEYNKLPAGDEEL